MKSHQFAGKCERKCEQKESVNLTRHTINLGVWAMATIKTLKRSRKGDVYCAEVRIKGHPSLKRTTYPLASRSIEVPSVRLPSSAAKSVTLSVPRVQRFPHLGGQVFHRKGLLDEVHTFIQHAVMSDDVGRVAGHEQAIEVGVKG